MVKQIKNLTENLAHNRGLKPFLFKITSGSIVMLSVLYFVLLGAVVNEAIGAKRNTDELRLVSQQFHDIEGEYFLLAKNINLDYAMKLGFVNDKESVKYVFAVKPFAKR